VKRSVGGYEVVALLDGTGQFFDTRDVAFTGATGDDWSAARRLDPAAFGAGLEWVLAFRCFLVRGPGDDLTLVDAGIGPTGSAASSWAPVPGLLLDELTAVGVERASIGAVVLTHLHSDHSGWCVDGGGEPVFPNARYVVQRDEVAGLADADVAMHRVVGPLRDAGLLDQVDGEVRLAPRGSRTVGGITLLPTPGHTPGHQSVVVDGGEQIVLTGDAVVHAVQIVNPSVGYRYESDPELARQSRAALLDRAGIDRALLATAHLTTPFLRLW
jgi:glyoxylase-like metal-dependent hydrolase (beta-lactamase superfamily II)